MKVLTFSRNFPASHPRKEEPTYFVEKVLIGLLEDKVISKGKCVELARATGIPREHPMYYIDSIGCYDTTYLKRTTIRYGNRWKAGDMASLRIWSGKPYSTKQIEFAQVEVKKVWNIEIYQGSEVWEFKLNDKPLTWDNCDLNEFVDTLAKNDGLTTPDFLNWFSIHPKAKERTFRGQIISWSDKIDYAF